MRVKPTDIIFDDFATGAKVSDMPEKPTLLIGQVSSGKSYLLRNAIMPGIFSSMRAQDAAVIFATKREMIDGFYHPENGDLLLDYNASKPECIWNIFAEMEASNDQEKTLVELCDVMFSKHKNTVQPFFTKAPKDMFKSLTMYLAESYEQQTGKKPTNSTLIGFFDTITLKDAVVNGKTRKGLLTLIKEVPGLHHLADYLGEGGTAQALGVLGELRTVLKETFQGGAFIKPGTFSVRKALKEGKKIFLLFNYAESTESSIVFFDMILDQMIKQSLAENKASHISDEHEAEQVKELLQACRNDRERELFAFRFGLKDGVPEILQEPANRFGINRERARQIESMAVRRITGHIRRRKSLADFLND